MKNIPWMHESGEKLIETKAHEHSQKIPLEISRLNAAFHETSDKPCMKQLLLTGQDWSREESAVSQANKTTKRR